MDVVDYSGEIGKNEGTFIFLKPSLSDITNIYTLPFTPSVWLTYFVVLAVLTVAMFIVQNAERQMDHSDTTEPTTIADAVMTTIAVVCQEGTSRDPKNLSSRILFLSMLMLSLFVTVSYSAIIISLLQTTYSAIQTLADLVDSPFELTMKDFNPNIGYIKETTDPVVERLYYTKILTKPHSQAFTSSEVGVKRIRQGMHAFHGDADAYKLILDTFEEHEKCKLKTIDMYPSFQSAIAVQKGSALKEYFMRSTRWLRESGILDRETKYWIIQLPKCQGNAESFTSVRIQDFYPALLVLAYGAAIAVGFLVLENLYSRFKIMKIDKLKTVR
ncbi:ionotropic receptor 75a-like [Periplaneta americana]|uniref:ionotropic receptor 75a-like n=1 Tax=Periplaneta americana TaxID=6978 RepID=UPI0037E92CCA